MMITKGLLSFKVFFSTVAKIVTNKTTLIFFRYEIVTALCIILIWCYKIEMRLQLLKAFKTDFQPGSIVNPFYILVKIFQG